MPAHAVSHDPLQDQLEELVSAHTKRKSEPLHLAVRFSPPKGKKHVHLFEVLGRFGGGSVSPDRKIFTVSFGTTPSFPLPPDTELRMVLTNPVELSTAIDGHWGSLDALRASKAAGTATVLYADTLGRGLWRRLK